MNYIGLDLSLTSTGMIIESKNKNLLFNYTTKSLDYVWIKEVRNLINFRHHDLVKRDSYSENEITKLKNYDEITNNIIKDILNNINIKDKTIIGIEGYSYRSLTSSVIDIIGYSTLMRIKLLNIPNLEKITIIAPTSLKKDTSVSVYGYLPPEISKKTGKPLKDQKITQNNNGVAGGSFEKIDMMQALLDSDVNINIKDYLKTSIKQISNMSSVPKPWDDLIDSFWAKEYIKRKFLVHI